MDFKDSPQEAKFREEVRAWLDKNAPEFYVDHRGIGDDTEEELARAKAWQKRKAEAGYACLLWPEVYGGPGRTPIEAVIYQQEEAKHRVPRKRQSPPGDTARPETTRAAKPLPAPGEGAGQLRDERSEEWS